MASSTLRVSEEQFQCSICLEVFTDPVSTACGHNFCLQCISRSWDSSEGCVCPLCEEGFPGRPQLHVNTTLRDVVEQFKEMNLRGSAADTPGVTTSQSELQKLTQERQQILHNIRQSVKLSKETASKDIEDCLQVHHALVRPIQESQAQLIKEIEENQKKVEERAEGLVQDLEMELIQLAEGKTPVASKNWSEISVHGDLGVVLVRATVAGLGKKLESIVENARKDFYGRELKRIQKYAVDVTLDPDTACLDLFLSDDRKQVKLGKKKRGVPDTPRRFDTGLAVLGAQGYSSGAFYYEVLVGDKEQWDVGVAYESVNRKGSIDVRLKNGYVALCKNGDQYVAQDKPFKTFSLAEKPQKVGVFVDYEGGTVSFYDVGNARPIYTFSGCQFRDTLCPYINVCKTRGVALVITPVNQSD